MDTLARAELSLCMNEAMLDIHRENGDKRALRATQCRINGLRTKVAKLVNERRAVLALRAWSAAA